ncbi:hypothetical protein [Inhella gelatinilytica]|uniref:Uncharacterized protein n=1 Tax=Inhella gelatinilytica TaxID=2795030 RepID=A0A931IVF1_9BURK|nr:hypothetical protein [Inhella gelatinilytica]MBH9553525.1 hypothetical protein [Inhella gelatinilytica]
MSLPRLLSLIAAASLLWTTAPAAQASELVKLARLIVTGKRSPTVAPIDTKGPATPAAAVKTDTPASPEQRATPTPAASDESSEPSLESTPARSEPPRTDRVGHAPQRASLG